MLTATSSSWASATRYRGGHLELGIGAERLAPVVEAFLDTDLTTEGNR
jgi:hypothetical protein